MSVLSLEHLTISISNDKVLVNDVNLEIALGEIHGLIGESGSGKSLTAMSILNLLPKNMAVKGKR